MLRHLYLFKHSFDKVFDILYWPTVDLILWGITSLFIKSFNPASFSTFVAAIISGLIFWQIVTRGQLELSVDILEELWNKNLIHLFASPLKFSEWIFSFIFLGILKLAVSLTFVSLLAFLFYKVSIFSLGLYFIPFMGLLMMSGWWIGLIIGSIILRYGSRVQVFAWSFGGIISPFSAIFYPVSILPAWAQKISWFLPTSHIFEGMRSVIYKGTLDARELLISFVLNIIFLTIAILILRRNFRKVLEKGLIKVY